MTQDRKRSGSWTRARALSPKGIGESMRPTARQDEAVASSAPSEHADPDKRSTPRVTVLIRAAKLIADDAEFLCVMRNVSDAGVSVRLFHPLPPDAELTLELPNGDRHPLERVWEQDDMAGFRFTAPVELTRIVEDRSRFRRRPVRVRVELPCVLVVGQRRVRATIGNLSQQGALVSSPEHLSLAQRVRLEGQGLPGIAAKVRWRRGDDYGLSFEDTFQFAELAELAFFLQREVSRHGAGEVPAS